MTEKSNSRAAWSENLPGPISSCDRDDLASIEEDVLHLHALLHRQLSRHIVSLGLHLSDAEDILQESFLELYRHLLARRSRQNLPGWLFRVTHRMAIRRRRQQRPLQFVHDQVDVDTFTTPIFNPEEEAIFNERQNRLKNIFLVLPELDRLCLQLRSEGLSYREIAGALQISLGSVHNSLTRSFDRLKSGQQELIGR